MASAHSLVRNYNEFIPPVDLDFMVKAMAQKQQQYDQNYAALQEQIDAIGAMDLAKDADRQYLYEKTQSLIKEINMSGQTDLSSKGVTRQISNHIKQALDENVVNGLQNTAAMRRYQAEVAEIKKNGKGDYSLMNEVYGFIPIQEWLEDGQVGTSIQGNARYTPYTDVQKKYVDFMKEMAATRGTQKFTFQDPNMPGRLIEREFRGLHPEEVRTVFEGMLSPQDRQQLVINGWYNFSQASPDYAKEVLKNTSDVKLSEYDGKIKELNLKIKGATGQTKTDYENTLDLLTKNRKTFQDNIVALSETGAENIGAHLEKERLIGGLVEMHKYEMKSEEWKSDAVYWEDAKLKLDKEVHQFNKYKFEKEQEDKVKAANSGLTFANGGTGIGDFTPPDPIELGAKLDASLGTSIKGAWMKVPGVTEGDYQSIVKATQAEIEKTGKDLNEALWEKYLQVDGRVTREGTDKTGIQQQIDDRRTIKKVIKDANDDISNTENSPENIKKVMAEVYDQNLGVQIGSKFPLSLREEWNSRYFKQYGVRGTKEQVLDFASKDVDLRNGMKAQIAAINLLAKQEEIVSNSLGLDGVVNDIFGKREDGKSYLQFSGKKMSIKNELNQLTSMFGENVPDIDENDLTNTNISKTAPKTAAYLKSLQSKYGTNAPYSSHKFRNLKSVEELYNPDVREQRLKDARTSLMKNSSFNVVVGVNVNSPLHKPLADLATTLGLNGIDKNLISVAPSADGVVARIARTPTEDDPKPFSSVNISRDDLQRNGLLELLNLEAEKGQVNQNLFVPQRIQMQPYFNVEKVDERETAASYLTKPGEINLVADGYAEKYLFAQVPNLQENYPNESAAISTILNTPTNVTLNTSKSKVSGNIIVSAIYNKENKEVSIGELSFTPEEYKGIKNILLQTPQLILTNILTAQIVSGTPSKTLTEFTNELSKPTRRKEI